MVEVFFLHLMNVSIIVALFYFLNFRLFNKTMFKFWAHITYAASIGAGVKFPRFKLFYCKLFFKLQLY